MNSSSTQQYNKNQLYNAFKFYPFRYKNRNDPFKQIVDLVWIMLDYNIAFRIDSKKRKKYRDAVRHFLFNLYNSDCIGIAVRYSKNRNYYTIGKKLRRIYYGYEIFLNVEQKFKDHGLIHFKQGNRAFDSHEHGLESRMWPTDKLVQIFKSIDGRPVVARPRPSQVFLLRDTDKNPIYVDANNIAQYGMCKDEYLQIQNDINLYNDFCEKQFVTLRLKGATVSWDFLSQLRSGFQNGDVEIYQRYEARGMYGHNLPHIDLTKLVHDPVTYEIPEADSQLDDSVTVSAGYLYNKSICKRKANVSKDWLAQLGTEIVNTDICNENFTKFEKPDYLVTVKNLPVGKFHYNYFLHNNNTINYNYISTHYTSSILNISILYYSFLRCFLKTSNNWYVSSNKRQTKKKYTHKFKKKLKPVAIDKDLVLKCNYLYLVKICNNATVEDGGRIYGTVVQSLPQRSSKLRSRLEYFGEETCEWDYSSLHVRLLYDLYIHKPCPEDIYTRDGEKKKVKYAFLTMLNSDDEGNSHFPKTIKGIRKKWLEVGLKSGDGLTDIDILDLIHQIMKSFPELKPYIGSGIGVKLMAIDSKISTQIINNLRKKGIFTSPIHDSYIVERKRYECELIDQMFQVYHQFVGQYPEISLEE